jgi:hypothetical protein
MRRFYLLFDVLLFVTLFYILTYTLYLVFSEACQ